MTLGTIHLRRRQIFTIFDPYPPTIGIPYEGDFLSLCTVNFGPSAHGDTPPPQRHADVLNGWSLREIYSRILLFKSPLGHCDKTQGEATTGIEATHFGNLFNRQTILFL